MQKYRTILADPPWLMDDIMGKSRSMGKRGGWNAADGRRKELAENYSNLKHLEYPQMTVEQIAAIEIPSEKDAHCYIWTVNRYVEQTYQIMRAWGFKPAQLLTWAKCQ